MQNSDKWSDKFAELRREAEKIVNGQQKAGKELTDVDLIHLLQELEIHQVELQLQNEELRAARMELEQSRDRYAELYEHAPVAYVNLDRQGLITQANLAARDMLGLTPKHCLNYPFHPLIHPGYQKVFRSLMGRLAKSGEPKGSCEIQMAWKNEAGVPFVIQMEVAALKNASGRLKGWRAALVDITGRKQAEAERAREEQKEYTIKLEQINQTLWDSEERYQALVKASSQVIYRMSPDWSEMRELRGGSFIADTEKPNRNWLEQYIHPDDKKRVIEVIGEAVRTGTIFELEHRVLRVDGTLGWTWSRAVPVRNGAGEVIEWFGAASDITERKRMEEELRSAREELQVKVRELQEKSEHLEEANIALKVLLKHREDDQRESGEMIVANVRNLVLPYLEKLKRSRLTSAQSTLVGILESNLSEVTSSFTRRLGIQAADLTPTELQVAALVRDGRSTAQIAEALSISEKTVETHRGRIRKKLGLQGLRANLRSHLLRLS